MLSCVAACCPVMVEILNVCNNKALLLLGLCRLVLYASNCPLSTSWAPAGTVARGSPTHPFPSLLPFPSRHCIPFHSLPCPFSPPRNDPKPMQSRTLWSAVSSPSEVRGRAPTANAFRYILSRWNVSGGNDFGCFSCEPKCCNWSGSSLYVSRGTSTPLPLHEAPMIGLRHGYWLKSLINVTDVSL